MTALLFRIDETILSQGLGIINPSPLPLLAFHCGKKYNTSIKSPFPTLPAVEFSPFNRWYVDFWCFAAYI
jgi:hypothetical protein